jgi:plasmid segregation protein ParM
VVNIESAPTSSELTLTIDIGYGTLMWMVTRGYTPVPERSGDSLGGVHSVLYAMIRSMHRDAADIPEIQFRLDDAILTGKQTIKIDGRDVEVAPHLGARDRVIEENVAAMMRSVRSLSDIANVIVTGGGAHMYLPELKNVFKDRNVKIDLMASQFRNLTGFQRLAEDALAADA